MNPRIEPQLQPAEPPAAGEPGLRVDPARRVGQPGPPAAPQRRSILDWVFGSVLACIALLLLTIVALRWLPPPTSSYMLQSPVKPVQYRWVPASAIADTMRRAVVAAEDQKFRSHHGFDVEAIRKAEQYNREHQNRRRGASTISQQTAKNMFLWPGGYVRKGIEAALTVLIEKIWGKDRILEVYLNIAEFGPGIYGVEAAAQNDFGKPASLLTADEAARLAAVLPNPRHWSVRAPSAYVQSRAAWVLRQMGYGASSAPQEEPEPPASEMPDAGDTDEPPPDSSAPPPSSGEGQLDHDESHDGAAPSAVPSAAPPAAPANPSAPADPGNPPPN